ncbi:TA system VapC family ribonuclease toxin [Rhodoferax sp. OV413]|uniref:TA system VapC family ribonuclease toxin n=1 Tax=Rhodoferax sp. OV413 TaxID=1855285 RepID=UPI0025FEE7C7|nr:TA system VapC family ribonuclease toxin [Rhodoferax sp. OV413]
MTPDVNVILAASRKDHAHHTVALGWLVQALESARQGNRLSLLPGVLASYLRLATHPRIFSLPTPAQQAVGFVDALLACPGVDILAVQGEWQHLRSLCMEQNLSGNDLPDAWIAACVLQQEETLATFDRDFERLLPANRLLLLQPTDP